MAAQNTIIAIPAIIGVNVNEKVYHLTMNLFTTNDNEKVYHIPFFDNEIVYHPSVIYYSRVICPVRML